MDWTEFREIDAEGRRVKFWAFSLILSYSRFMYVEFVDRCDTQTIIACHERAFRAMGGVPAEILYDRQSPVYRGQQGRGGEIILNPVFEQFARHWGFEQQRTGNVSYHLRQCLGLVELYGQATGIGRNAPGGPRARLPLPVGAPILRERPGGYSCHRNPLSQGQADNKGCGSVAASPERLRGLPCPGRRGVRWQSPTTG